MASVQKGAGLCKQHRRKLRSYRMMATAPKQEGRGDEAIEGCEEHVQYPVCPGMQSLRDALKESESTIAELKTQLRERSHHLEQEVALRQLLGRQCDDLNRKLQPLEQQVCSLTKENAVNSPESSESKAREVAILQEKNHQLVATLTQTESRLENLKLLQARMEATSSARIAAQRAALVERLSSVQRERERALATQLRTALEERDKALMMVQCLESKDTSDTRIKQEAPSEKSLQKLMEDLHAARDCSELQQGGVALVEQLKRIREVNMHSIQGKVDLLRLEKETAISKKQALDAEISRLQRQLEMMETEYKLVDKTRVKALQAQLQAALSEKEEWQQKAVKFEDACETLRVLSCLQRSLSKEEDIKRKYEGEMQKLHMEKVSLTDQLEHALQERNVAVQERNFVIQERNTLALQMQQEYERAERFQRLVLVLRKKAMAAQLSPSLQENTRSTK